MSTATTTPAPTGLGAQVAALLALGAAVAAKNWPAVIEGALTVVPELQQDADSLAETIVAADPGAVKALQAFGNYLAGFLDPAAPAPPAVQAFLDAQSAAQALNAGGGA